MFMDSLTVHKVKKEIFNVWIHNSEGFVLKFNKFYSYDYET